MIKPIDVATYNIQFHGNPAFHQNVAWYATTDDRIVGVVVRDLVDNDYSWVKLIQDADGNYTVADLDASLDTVEQATAELHKAMEQSNG